MIKFNQYNVVNTATKQKARVSYSDSQRRDGRKCVTLYAKDYDRSLGKVFPDKYINETDSMTDYYDQGRVNIFETDTLYPAALAMAKKQEQRWAAKRA